MSSRFIVPDHLSLEEAWDEVMAEVRRAATDRNHPFRNMQLATGGIGGFPRQRTVVRRQTGTMTCISIPTAGAPKSKR